MDSCLWTLDWTFECASLVPWVFAATWSTVAVVVLLELRCGCFRFCSLQCAEPWIPVLVSQQQPSKSNSVLLQVRSKFSFGSLEPRAPVCILYWCMIVGA